MRQADCSKASGQGIPASQTPDYNNVRGLPHARPRASRVPLSHVLSSRLQHMPPPSSSSRSTASSPLRRRSYHLPQMVALENLDMLLDGTKATCEALPNYVTCSVLPQLSLARCSALWRRGVLSQTFGQTIDRFPAKDNIHFVHDAPRQSSDALAILHNCHLTARVCPLFYLGLAARCASLICRRHHKGCIAI